MLTFALLKRANIILKQVIAFLLFGIFVSIHAVKLLHSHTNTVAALLSQDGDLVEKKGDCNICDYHLAKNGTVAVSQFEMQTLNYVKAFNSFYKSHPSSSIGLYYADRGPPAFV